MPYQFPTPYVTPDIITNATTGISWATIPYLNASPQEQLAEQYNICQRATGLADTAANQVLRATITTEGFKGPGSTRWQANGWGGNSTILLARGPILSVQGGSLATASFPLQWTAIAANMFQINSPPLSVYGSSIPGDAGEFSQSITMAAQGISGRGSAFLQVTYTNGWPHCSLTSASTAGTTTLAVDDCTGFAPPAGMTIGAAGVLYDSVGGQETATVTAASVAAGPGTLTLSAPTLNAHQAGVVLSALPPTLQWGVILYCVSQALTRGATATTPQTLAPSGVKTSDGAMAIAETARQMIRDFRRIW